MAKSPEDKIQDLRKLQELQKQREQLLAELEKHNQEYQYQQTERNQEIAMAPVIAISVGAGAVLVTVVTAGIIVIALSEYVRRVLEGSLNGLSECIKVG